MSALTPFRNALIQSTRIKAIGVPAALLAKSVGMTGISRKISSMCEFVPAWTTVLPPGSAQPFFMSGAGGADVVARSLWWGGWRGFEKPMPDLFAALATLPGTILDIGAYSGFYSLVSARMRPEAKIFAFEPLAEVRAILQSNIDRNGLKNNITIVPVALSNRKGEASLVSPTSSTGLMESASSIQENIYAERMAGAQTVKTDTLDSLRNTMIGERISLIKLDVEAHEPAVLEGGRQTLAEDRPFLFMEVLGKTDTRTFQAYFDGLNYRNAFLSPEGIVWRRSIRNEGKLWNHILCPEEKTTELGRAAKDRGLTIIDADLG